MQTLFVYGFKMSEDAKNKSNTQEVASTAKLGLRLVDSSDERTPSKNKLKSTSKFAESLSDFADRLEVEIQHILSL